MAFLITSDELYERARPEIQCILRNACDEFKKMLINDITSKYDFTVPGCHDEPHVNNENMDDHHHGDLDVRMIKVFGRGRGKMQAINSNRPLGSGVTLRDSSSYGCPLSSDSPSKINILSGATIVTPQQQQQQHRQTDTVESRESTTTRVNFKLDRLSTETPTTAAKKPTTTEKESPSPVSRAMTSTPRTPPPSCTNSKTSNVSKTQRDSGTQQGSPPRPEHQDRVTRPGATSQRSQASRPLQKRPNSPKTFSGTTRSQASSCKTKKLTHSLAVSKMVDDEWVVEKPKIQEQVKSHIRTSKLNYFSSGNK